MKSRFLYSFVIVIAILASTTQRMPAQNISDVIGVHDLSPSGPSPITGGVSSSCLYCHAPHSGIGGMTPLWNQTLSSKTYTVYGSTSTTYLNKGNTQPTLGTDSTLCLSCHDGSVAPGQTREFGTITMTGAMKDVDKIAGTLYTNLQGSHPFSLVLPFQDSPDLVQALYQSGKTADPLGMVKLVKSNVECTSCHNPHVQSIDAISPNFLVRDSSSGQMCLACHDPARVMTGKTNMLAGWTTSIHATSTSQTSNQTQSYVGGYGTVALNSCLGCHMPHNANGATRLLRAANELDCVNCHNGGSNLSPAIPNVYAEYAKISHPVASVTNPHDASENVLNPLPTGNRHSTCVDCHNPHASQVSTFTIPPIIRASQNGVVGISADDGVTIVNPAVNQYDNCLRCHGTSTGKVTNPIFGYSPVWVLSAGDPLNVIPQFAKISTSSHPVTHDRTSALAQPSLRNNMMNIDGTTPGRSMGVRVLCTDCHNSDDNREFGGTGPNGPHGSKWTHLLERRYEFSQAPGTGLIITNLFPNPDLTVTGPYAMCAKCHDLTNVVSNATFSEHARHINDGFSCSTCHTAHGMGAQSSNLSGERLVNFDVNVVAPNGAVGVSYKKATNSCSLVCHGHAHQLQ